MKKNNAAYFITRPEDLESGLLEVLTNSELREQIVQKARKLASENHDEAINPQKVKAWLRMAVDNSLENR